MSDMVLLLIFCVLALNAQLCIASNPQSLAMSQLIHLAGSTILADTVISVTGQVHLYQNPFVICSLMNNIKLLNTMGFTFELILKNDIKVVMGGQTGKVDS